VNFFSFEVKAWGHSETTYGQKELWATFLAYLRNAWAYFNETHHSYSLQGPHHGRLQAWARGALAPPPLEMLKSVLFAANVVWNLSRWSIYASFWENVVSSHRGAAPGLYWGTSSFRPSLHTPGKNPAGARGPHVTDDILKVISSKFKVTDIFRKCTFRT